MIMQRSKHKMQQDDMYDQDKTLYATNGTKDITPRR